MLKVNEIKKCVLFNLKFSLQFFDFIVLLFTQLVEFICFLVKD